MQMPFWTKIEFASAMSVYRSLYRCTPIHPWKFTYPSAETYLFVRTLLT